MRKMDYESLRDDYPSCVSMEQFRLISRIGKRSAKYLLVNEIVPCKDNGKKSCRYSIKISDVIEYLKKRDVIGTMIPPGTLSSSKNKAKMHRECFADLLAADEVAILADYFDHLLKHYPDVLTPKDVSTLTGFNKNTILRYLQNEVLQSITSVPRYIIPKQYFLEFVTSHRYIEASSNSKKFHNILGGFQKWITAKSLPSPTKKAELEKQRLA